MLTALSAFAMLMESVMETLMELLLQLMRMTAPFNVAWIMIVMYEIDYYFLLN